MKPFFISNYVPQGNWSGTWEYYVVLATSKADAIERLNFKLREAGRKESWELASVDDMAVEINPGVDVQLVATNDVEG